MSEGKFSVQKLNTDFKKSLIVTEGADDVVLSAYLSGFEELYKFLIALGSIFAWVVSDVKAKIDVLHTARKKMPKEYETLSTAISHEKPPRGDKSGPLRNLLRLHRALEYIIAFLKAVVELESDTTPCAPVSQEAYNKTLAKYHPWVMQKAALLAMKMLPHRGGLFEVIGSNHSRETVKDELNEAIEKMDEAYRRMQDSFGKCEMLSLP
uniref:Glycolipid transfer protein domain-containing protein 1 n=1 Tax=Lepeophtheirus salmonis TaxID=72036 RepID=C1BUI1_LEPSM|nr:Glycolipid transfer protein domain-containing protein 1 [Lepeophtheirus salmonis]